VAHEINNPLAFILGNLEYALGVLETLESSSRVEPVETDSVATRVHDVCAALADARTGAERVRTIVAELKRLARPPSEKREAVDLRHILDAALSMTAGQVSECAAVVREFGDCPRVRADAARLTQVFVNLLLNAVLAIQERKSAPNEVRLRTGTDEEGNAYAEVADTGIGIAQELLPRIFEPFFTTRSLRPGAGLGLAVAHGIVASLGGSIQVRSAPGSGNLFRVVLPASPSTKPPADQAAAPHRAQTSAKRLLVIDDEKFLLDTLRRVLEEDYEVTTAHGGRQALELLESGERFDVILSDLLMPGVTGMDLFDELEKSHPAHASRIVFMTGGAFTPRAQRFLSGGRHAVLEKPFTSSELLDFLERFSSRTSSKTGP
ncbi:MAG TPA: ATP-binding protein, partial [Polyangiaceae bacterium]